MKDEKGISRKLSAELGKLAPGFGLYVNYPLCVSRCAFCIYHVARYDRAAAELFLQGYRAEAGLYAGALGGYRFGDVHIGGGTPNLARPEDLLEPLRPLARFGGLRSLVVEASPRRDLGDFVERLRPYGLTKLMLGVQALDQAVLKGEGRHVLRETALENARLLSKSGLSWSVDFVYGLRDHGAGRDHEEELREILRYRPSGLHLYAIRSQAENSFYGGRGGGRQKFMGNFDFRPLHARLRAAGYERIGDEWCLLADERNVRLAHRTGAEYGESCTVALGPAGRGRLRTLKYMNHRDLPRYAAAAKRGVFPVGRLFDYGRSLYLAADFLLEVNESSRFRLRRALASRAFTPAEKKALGGLLELLRGRGVAMREEAGVLEIDRSDWSRCLLLAEKFLSERGGSPYFYKN